MKRISKKVFKKIIHLFKPIIRFIANECDIKILYPWTGLGQHPLVFKDNSGYSKGIIPKSVFFNTRSGKIVIGKNTVFGEDVMVLTGKHKFISEIDDMNQLHEVPENGRDIYIGDNCYIGGGAIIIGPVTIGDFSVIGAGSVVTKDIPAKTMYAGIPAKKIKDLNFKNEISHV